MSGLEIAAGVAAIVGAFSSAVSLIRNVKKDHKKVKNSRKAADAKAKLEVRLRADPQAINTAYDRAYVRLRAPFARGDDIGREQLQWVLIDFQARCIETLRAALSQGRSTFELPLRTSVETRERALRVLSDQAQRIEVRAGPQRSLSDQWQTRDIQARLQRSFLARAPREAHRERVEFHPSDQAQIRNVQARPLINFPDRTERIVIEAGPPRSVSSHTQTLKQPEQHRTITIFSQPRQTESPSPSVVPSQSSKKIKDVDIVIEVVEDEEVTRETTRYFGGSDDVDDDDDDDDWNEWGRSYFDNDRGWDNPSFDFDRPYRQERRNSHSPFRRRREDIYVDIW